MIIEIPGFDFRISGEALNWQIQFQHMEAGEKKWVGKYFYSNLEFAVAKAYEMILRESKATVDISEIVGECSKVKSTLIKAVKKAQEGVDKCK